MNPRRLPEIIAEEIADRFLPDNTFSVSINAALYVAILNVVKDERKILFTLSEAIDVIEFYGAHETWDKELFLAVGKPLRDDLEETDWSRFTPGKKAREFRAKVKKELGL